MNKIIYALLLTWLFFCYLPIPVLAQEDQPINVRTITDPPPADGSWVPDKTITIAGKLASRSAHFLNWTFAQYNWACIDQNCNGNNASGDPFADIFKVVRDITYAMLSLSILFSSFIMIITRGREIKITKFVGRFILTVLLVTIIYSLIIFIYQVVDIVIGFFLRYNNQPISSANLLNVDFGYQTFKGYKKAGLEFSESAFVSLWLTRLTAFTYFAISIILIVRKIILWFFLIISPLFPLLLLFKGLRGIYKIWLGEFLRWLFYAPLFAVLLSGVVTIWVKYIPVNLKLDCDKTVADANRYPHDPSKYPTAISIELGGPCQNLTEDNNLNTPDSFIQYVVALLMLWMVIIVPFLLLRMLIEYFGQSFEENNLWRLAVQKSQPFFDRYTPNFFPAKPPNLPFKPIAPDTSPAGLSKTFSPDTTTGLAKPLPILQGRENLLKNYPRPSEIDIKTTVGASAAIPAGTHISEQVATGAKIGEKLAQSIGQSSSVKSSVSSNVSTMMGNQTAFETQSSRINTQANYADTLNLTNLSIPTMVDITRYETAQLSGQTHLVDDLNKIAEGLKRVAGTSLLTTPQEKISYEQIKQQLENQATQKNPVAASILSAAHPGASGTLPEVNQVQTVALQDYEMVKKLWKQNYQTVNPPTVDQKQLSKKEWLKMEKDAIEKAMRLVASSDPKEVEEGKQLLSKILPFLLLGGFSKAEIVAYLKAKQSAATEVLDELEKTENSDSLVEVDTRKKETSKQMSAEADLPNDTTQK